MAYTARLDKIQKAYDEGYNEFFQEGMRNENPYAEKAMVPLKKKAQYDAWQRGWEQAQRDDLA